MQTEGKGTSLEAASTVALVTLFSMEPCSPGVFMIDSLHVSDQLSFSQ